MFKKKLLLLAALIVLGASVSSAATWKAVQASTTGAVQAGMTGYALNLGSGTIRSLTASTVTASVASIIDITPTNILGTVTDKSTTTHSGSHIFSSMTAVVANIETLAVTGNGTVAGTLGVTGQTSVSTLTASGQLSGKGTVTNDDAASGFIGEYTSSKTVSNALLGTTGVYVDILAISLSAGDWDVTGFSVASANGGTISRFHIALSTSAGNDESFLTDGDTLARGPGPINAVNGFSLVIPDVRFSLSTAKTIYLKGRADYTVATPTTLSRVSARRRR